MSELEDRESGREAREEEGARRGVVRQLRRIGLRNIVPFATWMRDRPWELGVVRGFVFFTLFPLFMVSWAALTDPKLGDVAFIFGIYFALIWGVVIYLFIRPERIGISDVVRVSLFTAVVGVFLVGTVQQFPGVRLLYEVARAPSLLPRAAGFVFGVGLLEELVKMLPLLWIFVRNGEPGTIREITFLGCVSGFAFGISESVAYSLGYAFSLNQGLLGFEDFIVVQFTRLITLPLLHAMFTGVAAHFIALGVAHRGSRRGLIVFGLLVAATLHGLYNTFAASLLGFMIAVVSVLVFIAYVRSAASMDLAITEAYDRAEP